LTIIKMSFDNFYERLATPNLQHNNCFFIAQLLECAACFAAKRTFLDLDQGMREVEK